MIELNTKISTIVNVDLSLNGTNSPLILRLLLHADNFFVGFEGQNNQINIPPISSISWPDSGLVKSTLEIIVENHYLKIWNDTLKLSEIDVIKESINKIDIKVNLVGMNETKNPVIEIKPIF